jgi:hypothetical protein
VLFLSSRFMVALRFEYLPGLDGGSCRTPVLLDRRSSETEVVDFVTVVIGLPRSLGESPPLIMRLRLPRAEGSGQGWQRLHGEGLLEPFPCQIWDWRVPRTKAKELPLLLKCIRHSPVAPLGWSRLARGPTARGDCSRVRFIQLCQACCWVGVNVAGGDHWHGIRMHFKSEGCPAQA